MVPQHGSFASNVVLKAKHISVLPELLLNHRTSRSSSFATFLFGSAGQHQTCPRALSFLAKLSTCLWRWLEHWTFGALSPQVSRMLIRVSHLSGCPRHLDWNIKMKPDPKMWATDGLTESDRVWQFSSRLRSLGPVVQQKLEVLCRFITRDGFWMGCSTQTQM